MFGCRIPGVYVFMFNINTDSDSMDTEVRLMKNGRSIVGAARDYTSEKKDGGVSGSAVLVLEEGDQVYLEYYGHVSNHNQGAGFSNFSGYLLYQN